MPRDPMKIQGRFRFLDHLVVALLGKLREATSSKALQHFEFFMIVDCFVLMVSLSHWIDDR